ncbi:hypothetical protein PR202_gb20546 [Eleusine coracana subsp. coracana]|uniref:Uncharacterized protein n=1 Tax=Eleusine coracana subsp. coracana TaxID=191504 RepID=A0AAV5FB08_ELECO|nr:hypothetical protein PR202_gb20546 [Eleusine coracana subsp. coracana]
MRPCRGAPWPRRVSARARATATRGLRPPHVGHQPGRRNDLHVLPHRRCPPQQGHPPPPRESTRHGRGATGSSVFGAAAGRGQLTSATPRCTCHHERDLPESRRPTTGPQDSHGAVPSAAGLVYGRDCGTFLVKGASPGVRAGHAAVSVGSKLEACGQQPQGRFSHTAVLMNTDIAIYGGCGEDERPLNELLILQLGSEHPNGRYNISMCKVLSNHWSQEKRKFLRAAHKDASVNNGDAGQKPREAETERRNSFLRGLALQPFVRLSQRPEPDLEHSQGQGISFCAPWHHNIG